MSELGLLPCKLIPKPPFRGSQIPAVIDALEGIVGIVRSLAMRRRDFMKGIAGSATAWPLTAHTQPKWPTFAQLQQTPMHVVQQAYSLESWGEFRRMMMTGDFSPKIKLDEVMARHPTVGVGAVSDARGEISIFDGKLVREPRWVSMQDIRKGPPPDNGLEVLYSSASFNDKMLGHGEPVRVREGERVLFRLLNASPTENISLAIAGHRFTVVALDGNPVPTERVVDTVFLAPAERADVIVTMDNPGVWIFGGVKDEDRSMGLGTVIEYANRSGEPQWLAPTAAQWDYTLFGDDRVVPQPDHSVELVFEKIPGGHGGYNRWTLNGKSWPDTNPLFSTEVGKRYRLVMSNKSGDNHPVHLHRHTFEITKVGEKTTAGVMKDTVNMTRFSTVEIDFVADDPGPTLLHCHHQDHQDEGFMGLVTYL